MKLSLSMKTMFRSVGKTLVTFLLVTAVTFALFSQVAEFAVTSREFQRAADLYVGTGTVEGSPTSPIALNTGYPQYFLADSRIPNSRDDIRYEPITSGQIEEIFSMDYIDFVDVRYMTAGVSDKYYRLDDGGNYYNYSTRCVIEGTVTSVEAGVPMTFTDGINPVTSENSNYVYLEDCKILSGNVPWDVTGTEQVISGPPIITNLDTNIGFVPAQIYNRVTDWYFFDNEFSNSLLDVQPGGRYVFVCRFEPLFYINDNNYPIEYYLGDSLTNDWCNPIWRIDDKPENYLDTEEFAPLKELVEITNSDIHTFDMVYTENTGSIKRFADGDMVIIDGRGLEPEDSESKNTVCVVSHAFANANGLEVGDTLNFNLGTELFEQYKSLGALAVTHERYKAADTPVSLEIVGIYSNTDGATNEALQPNWSYSDATVFLPSSFFPAEVPAEHMYSPAEFSFTVRAWDITPFLEETAPKIEAMGLSLTFNDGGWIDIETAFKETDKLAVVRIGILAAAMVIADGFAVYLFISRRKKDYGIMRALGTTKRASSKAISVPFICLSVLSIASGTIVGFIYTKHTLYQNQAINLLADTSASAVIPGWTIAACALGELILILIVTGIMIHNMGKQPPLLLLQGKGGKKAKKKSGMKREFETVTVSESAAMPKYEPSSVTIPEIDRGSLNGSGTGFILRYILRHMRRAVWKTVLSVLVAGIMLAAVGQFKVVQRSYESLCKNTVVTARFVGGLPVSSGRGLMNSGYAKNLYYGVGIPSETNGLQIDVALTNNINRYTNEKADIDFAPGYDDSCISEPGNTVIIGNELMEMYSLKPGDSVHLISEAMKESLWTQAYFEYSKKHLNSQTEPDQTEINSIYQELFTQSLEEYTIAGVVTTPSGNYGNTIFMPGNNDTSSMYGSSLPADLIEVTLSDYRRLDELKSFGERIVKASPEVSFVLDAEKLEAPLNTLNLLTKLYPTIMAAALAIGAFLCCLILLQSSKEASIMRVLGTTKGKARAIMALEQIFLCIIGLIVGFAGLVIYNRGNILTVMGQLGIFAAAYLAVIILASLVISTLIMRRDLLSLLQTKE